MPVFFELAKKFPACAVAGIGMFMLFQPADKFRHFLVRGFLRLFLVGILVRRFLVRFFFRVFIHRFVRVFLGRRRIFRFVHHRHIGRRFVLRQRAEAENVLVRQLVPLLDDLAANVSFHGFHRLAAQLGHNADMVARAVAVCIKKHQIARLRRITARALVKPRVFQPLCPVHAARSIRNIRLHHARVMQAERSKHRAPFAVRIPVPCAVARVAVLAACVIDLIVAPALRVANLALCHQRNVLACRFAGQLGDCRLPLAGAFQICEFVRIADQAVRMLRLRADKLARKARFRMPVRLRNLLLLFLAADQRLFIAAAVLGMRMPFDHLWLRADEIAFFVVAIIRVLVQRIFAFLQTAGQNLFIIVARRRMDMPLRLHHVKFFVAEQHRLVAFIPVPVLLHAAVSLLRHCNGRQNQRIRRAEHDHRRQRHDRAAPALFPAPPACICCYLVPRVHCHLTPPYESLPNPASGQTLQTIFPTTCSSATQPTSECRESAEVDRWSPMQKYRLSGT